MFRRGLRLIGRSFRAHPVPHAIAIVGAVLFAVSVVALSRAVAWVTDNVIVPGLGDEGVSDGRLATGFGIIVVIALVRGAGAIVRRYYLAMASRSWRRSLRLERPMRRCQLASAAWSSYVRAAAWLWSLICSKAQSTRSRSGPISTSSRAWTAGCFWSEHQRKVRLARSY